MSPPVGHFDHPGWLTHYQGGTLSTFFDNGTSTMG